MIPAGFMLGFFFAACPSMLQLGGADALEQSIVQPITMTTMDFRAPVTRGQLDEYLSAPDFFMWDLPILGNERLKDWDDCFDPDAAIFHELTRAQQVLILVGQLDADVSNGGIGQLFFNRAPAVPAMQRALAEMGCAFAAELIDQELDRLAETNFIAKWTEARARADRQNKTSAEGHRRAWTTFIDFVDEMFPDDSATQAYFARSHEMIECARAYIATHTEELFDVVGP